MKKIVLIIGLILILPVSFSCSGQTKSAATKEEYMENLDSLLASYTTMPGYYVRYGNDGCLFDLRVNDNYVDNITFPSRIGSTLTPINAKILKSGKNKVSLKLYPFLGEGLIREAEPFHLKIQYKDFKQPKGKQLWNVVWTLPPVEVPDGGIPYFEYEGEFEAKVPYVLEDNDNYIDLREIPDIEKRVVAEFNKVLQLIRNKDKEAFNNYFADKNNQLGIVFYRTNKDVKYDEIYTWNDVLEGIDHFQNIEDYRLEFNNHGRSVTLRSLKKGVQVVLCCG